MKYPLIASLLLFAIPSFAEVLWQDFRVSYLKGNNYRLGDAQRSIYTFEHAAATSWGDSFLFLDHIRPEQGANSNYAEWAPRLSIGKLSDKKLEFGIIKDVTLASTLEMSEQSTHKLYGVGLDFNISGFRYMQLNGYRRNNDGKQDNWQTTLTWGLPFTLGNQQFLYDGFLDWSSTSSDQRASLNMTSQLKWLLSPLLGLKSNLYLGAEYVYWRNKFGLQHSSTRPTNESNFNLLVKWHY